MKAKIIFAFVVFFNLSLYAKNTEIRKCNDYNVTTSLTEDDNYTCSINNGSVTACYHKTKNITYEFYNQVKTSSYNEASECLQNPSLWDYCSYVDYNLLNVSNIINHENLKDVVRYYSNTEDLCNVYYKDFKIFECDNYYRGGYACFSSSRYCNKTARIVYTKVTDCYTPNYSLNLDKSNEELDIISNDLDLLSEMDFDSRMDMVCKKNNKGSFLGGSSNVKNYNALKTIKNQNKFSKKGFFDLLAYGSSSILSIFKPSNLGNAINVACEIGCSRGNVKLYDNKLGVSSFCSIKDLKSVNQKLVNSNSIKRASDLTSKDFLELERNIKDLERLSKEEVQSYEKLERAAYYESKEEQINELFNLSKYDKDYKELKTRLQDEINYNPIENLFRNKDENALIQVPKKNDNPNFNSEYSKFLEDNKLMDTNLEYDIISALNNARSKEDFYENLNLVFNAERRYTTPKELPINKVHYGSYNSTNTSTSNSTETSTNTSTSTNTNTDVKNDTNTSTSTNTNTDVKNDTNTSTSTNTNTDVKNDTNTSTSNSTETSTNTSVSNKDETTTTITTTPNTSTEIKNNNGSLDVNVKVKVDDINIKLDDTIKFSDDLKEIKLDKYEEQIKKADNILSNIPLNEYVDLFEKSFKNIKEIVDFTNNLELKEINKYNFVNSCPEKYSLNITDSYSVNGTYDICKELEPTYPILHNIFKLIFLLLALKSIYKLSIKFFK
ncbi:hypothetical protein AVANS_0662 [Campylobacter sp. RM5004]|uniref:hypothetical protein n=1 Tax=Campylobacter sp. RM5004 TaxID=1660078 RepID=UPI001EFB8A56|nr:hypothetical protein [Campylobacter sp. RM5004]ULO01293.1 hypothetical protein AVANS_0662 [Campylobacter sp. RM5004]